MSSIQIVVNHYLQKQGYDPDEIAEIAKEDRSFYARHLRPAKELLVLAESVEKATSMIDEIGDWAERNGLNYNINTVIKRYWG